MPDNDRVVWQLVVDDPQDSEPDEFTFDEEPQMTSDESAFVVKGEWKGFSCIVFVSRDVRWFSLQEVDEDEI